MSSEFENKTNDTITMGLPRSRGSVSTSNPPLPSTSCNRAPKRSWDDNNDTEEPPTKLLCTSPPHALCAEDVPQQPSDHPTAMTSSSEDTIAVPSTVKAPQQEVPQHYPSAATVKDAPQPEEDSDTEDRDLLDEEDKDSGFIDSNSVDNSSDDDMDVRLSTACSVDNSTSASYASTSPPHYNCSTSSHQSNTLLPSCSSAFSHVPPTSSYLLMEGKTCPGQQEVTCEAPVPNIPDNYSSSSTSNNVDDADVVSTSLSTSTLPSTSLALSLALLNDNNSSLCHTGGALESSEQVQSFSGLSPPQDCCPASSSSLPPVSVLQDYCSSTGELCNLGASIAGGPSDTVVTTAYPGTVPTHSYDVYDAPQSGGSPYLPDYRGMGAPVLPQNGIVTGSWSCNFYDSNSQPTINKYMEIQTSKSGGSVLAAGAVSPSVAVPASTSQAIQCDANGKSYMDLGSSSPFTQTYNSDCGNYTTSPSNYSNNGFNASQTGSSNYSPGPQQTPPQSPGPYYRPNYSQYSYPNGENYPGNYDVAPAGDVCSYGPYNGNGSATPPPSAGYPLFPSTGRKLLPPRCVSPFCDLTKPTRSPCYQQQRMSVLNMSMCKLNRFSRFPDPSLHKSVLICNTLRLIEKELENEGTSMNALLSQQHMMQQPLPPHCPPPPPPTPPPPPPPPPQGLSEGPLPPMQPPLLSSPPSLMGAPYSSIPQYSHYSGAESYEDLRLYSSTPGLQDSSTDPELLHSLNSQQPVLLTGASLSHPTPPNSPLGASTSNGALSISPEPSSFINGNNTLSNSSSSSISSCSSINSVITINSTSSTCTNNSSSMPLSPAPSTEDRTDSIDWCSVLSLPSQSDLDSMNNNEFCEWSSSSSSSGSESTASVLEMDYTSSCSSSINSSLISSSSASSQYLHHNSSAAALIPTTTSSSTTTVLLSSPDSIATTSSNVEDSTNSTSQWKLPSLSADDILKSFPDAAGNRRMVMHPTAAPPSDDLDCLMNVLVES